MPFSIFVFSFTKLVNTFHVFNVQCIWKVVFENDTPLDHRCYDFGMYRFSTLVVKSRVKI